MSENAVSLLTRAIDQTRRLSIADLRLVRRELCRLESCVETWRSRAITEARTRMRLAMKKNRLEALNKELGRRANNNFNDWLEARRIIRELETAIQRLPEPPPAFGDGPDERVGWVLRECESLKEAMERNLRVAQLVESRLEETTKMGEELIDERDRIIGHLEADLAHERETVTFLDASFDIKQRLVIAEANLVALRERAERVQEGEDWDLVEFILRKTTVHHAPKCLKNVAFKDCICTCGLEKN